MTEVANVQLQLQSEATMQVVCIHISYTTVSWKSFSLTGKVLIIHIFTNIGDIYTDPRWWSEN